MDEERLSYAKSNVDYMIEEGIILTCYERRESQTLFNFLNERAIQQDSEVHGLLASCAIGVVMLKLQWTAQLFRAILYHKHGRRYMHPVRFPVSALFWFLVLVVWPKRLNPFSARSFSSVLATKTTSNLLNSSGSYDSNICHKYEPLADANVGTEPLASLAGVVGSVIIGAFGVLAMMLIYIIGFVLVCIRFCMAWTTLKDELRHTMSVSAHWLDARTGNEFFLKTHYVYIIQPIAVFVVSLLLTQIIPVIGALLLMASVFFAIYSFAAARQIHDNYLNGIDARVEAEFRRS